MDIMLARLLNEGIGEKDLKNTVGREYAYDKPEEKNNVVEMEGWLSCTGDTR